jgi:hypothetical protein
MISFHGLLRLMLTVGLYPAMASAAEESEQAPRKLAKSSSKSYGYYAYNMNYHPRYYYPAKKDPKASSSSSSSSSSSYREPVYPRGKGKGNVFFNPYVPHKKIRKMGKGGYLNFFPRIPGPGPDVDFDNQIPFGIWPRVPFVPDAGPTASPSASPSAEPTTAQPTASPTTATPSAGPTSSPTAAPIEGTAAPTVVCVIHTMYTEYYENSCNSLLTTSFVSTLIQTVPNVCTNGRAYHKSNFR